LIGKRNILKYSTLLLLAQYGQKHYIALYLLSCITCALCIC